MIEAGGDPANIEGEKVLIKQKNEDIAALRKQLKLPQSETLKQKKLYSKKQRMMI